MNKYNTILTKRLVEAYNSTNFVVHFEPSFVLKVGEFNKKLETVFSKLNQKTACFITAYNPKSVVVSGTENKTSQKKLHEDLVELGCTIFNGFGADPSGKWEGEPSYFVIGIGLEEAKNLGRKYKQNVIIWCG